jgi:ATP-dependent Clp protease ATP-binding subunit ClpC
VEIVVRIPTRDKLSANAVRLPNLEEVAEPLTDRRLRKQFGPAWQRDREIARLANLLREDTVPVLIVGAPGSGKTTVLSAAVRQNERLASAERRKSTPDTDTNERQYKHRYWLTSAARLMAGMKYLGQWEERCEELIRELQQIEGVLCVEHLLDLVRSGGEIPQSGAAAFMATYMQRRELRLVAEATPEEVDACRRLLPGLIKLFVIVKLSEFDRADAVAVLNHLADDHERNSKITLSRGVTEYLVHAFQRFMPYHAFPGRAASFLEGLLDRARRDKQKTISLNDAQQYFSQRTGLPIVFLRDEVLLAPVDIEDVFRRRVVGQPAPCRQVTDLVTKFKAGLNDPSRPIGVMLFCGPTGVGKTELAKALADYFFGHGEQPHRMLRLDMSEYAGPGSGERLITAPDGSPSALIKRFRQQPFQLLLLDEIEKAAAEVFDVLMNVFDEGRLTDRYGRVTSFRSAVIVMTSNLGASLAGSLGFGPSRPVRYADEALAFFRPEFFNRIDAVLSFEPLSRETILAITRKELDEIANREGLQAAGLHLTWNDAVVEHLAAVGFDPRYGARPLQRALEVAVVAPLAKLLISSPGLRQRTIALSVQSGSVQVAAL